MAKASETGFLVSVGSGSGVAKNKYTRADDETIISMHGEGQKASAIGKALTPERSAASVTYRIGRVLCNLKNLNEYDYESGRSLITGDAKEARITERQEAAVTAAAAAEADSGSEEDDTDDEPSE